MKVCRCGISNVLVCAKAAIQVLISSLDSDKPAVEFVTDQIQNRSFVPSVLQQSSSRSQPAAKRQKISAQQKDLEVKLKSIKSELKAVKDARKTPAIVVDDTEDEFLTKFGENKGKKMKEFVRSISAMCMVRVIHGGSQLVVHRQGRIPAAAEIPDIETVGKVRAGVSH